MDSIRVQQTVIEKQVYHVASKLIEHVIAIKTARDPRSPVELDTEDTRKLMRSLDTWTDWLIAKEGGL